MVKRTGANPGAELVEWIVVTLIMIIATYAILQAVGPQLSAVLQAFFVKARAFFGG